jgi:hypothetical protein
MLRKSWWSVKLADLKSLTETRSGDHLGYKPEAQARDRLTLACASGLCPVVYPSELKEGL